MMDAERPVATIKDVAREAQVSTATVSRVFNHSSLVRNATQIEVRRVAQRLNYWPNGLARSLITNRTHTLGVLLPELHGEFFSGVIRGLDLTARKAGFHLLVSSSHSDTEELVSALRSMRGRIDGLVVMAPEVDAPAVIRRCAGSVPIVLIDPRHRIPGYENISIANFEGAYAVVRHLIGLGHRTIAAVTGPEKNVDARQRRSGYRAALRDAGIDRDPAYELRGDFTEPSGHRAGKALLALDPLPRAVFVGNDHMAVGVLRALSDAKVRVPEQIALAGFDDIETAQYLDPPLTTVRVDTFRIGERAIERLLHAVSGSDPGDRSQEVQPTTVVVRRSCGAAMQGREGSMRGRARSRLARETGRDQGGGVR